MQLHTLQLINFKNYTGLKLDLSPKVNVLVGKNGCGKTNLLDAIHYLSFTKSAFSTSDSYCIMHGEKVFSVKGVFRNEKNENEVLCSFQAGSKKTVRTNSADYSKLSEHIGRFPVVLIAPDDNEIVKEGSEQRRRFFDSIIAQLDKVYLESLIEYNQALRQRNALLKRFAESNSFDGIVLESYDKILARTGLLIYEKRRTFVQRFIPVFKGYYGFIVDNEPVDLEYASDLNHLEFLEGLAKSRQRDLLLQRTNFGVHRDDYIFQIGHGDLKRLGSQGQQKSFIIALKLAQFAMIRDHKGLKPILLLDDIFDKLDDFRIEKLLHLIKNEEFGQLFITDARPDRTAGFLKQIDVPARVFKVLNGEVSQQ